MLAVIRVTKLGSRIDSRRAPSGWSKLPDTVVPIWDENINIKLCEQVQNSPCWSCRCDASWNRRDGSLECIKLMASVGTTMAQN